MQRKIAYTIAQIDCGYYDNDDLNTIYCLSIKCEVLTLSKSYKLYYWFAYWCNTNYVIKFLSLWYILIRVKNENDIVNR